MDIFKIMVLAVITVTVSAILKQIKPEFAHIAVIGAGIVFFAVIFGYIKDIYDCIGNVFDSISVDRKYLAIMLKITVLAYLLEFTASLCKDAGESAVGVKVEICGKLMVLSMAVPVIKELIENILEMVV